MYIGLDLGTSGLKGLLLDADQRVVAEAHAPLTVSRPHAGWSEQMPAAWLTAASTVIDTLAADHDMAAVRAIGLSGQMHGATLLDKSGNVLRPCILWNDTRAHAEAADMDAAPEWRGITGNIVFPGFTAPKIAWVAAHEPDLFGQIDKVLLPKDYLRLWLTGEAVSEMSDAAGTGWLDTAARDWSDHLLDLTGLSRSEMPRLVEGSEASGTLRPELQSRWGFGPNVVVAGGGGDNAASAIGVGAVNPGDGFVSLGTSGVLFATCDAYRPDPASAVHTFCHALPATWHQMGVILSATDALNWYAGIAGVEAQTLTQDLPEALQPPGSALFLPYLGGERTPHNDSRIRGALTGIAHATDRAAGTRAVMEGVAYAVRDCYESLTGTGSHLETLVAVGGGSRSIYWLKIIATLLDLPVQVPADGDYGAAFGAARLAMMAAGDGGPEIAKRPAIARVVEPDPSLHGAFREAHARYRATYHALKDI